MMATNNLELELRRYEPSAWNDKITYEKHYYNGFSGMEGEEAYQRYLQGIYNVYFIELRKDIDTLALSNSIDTLLKFLQTKIDLFKDINDKEGNESTRWVDYESFKNQIIRDETVDRDIVQRIEGAKNDYNTMKFFVRMIGTQLYFIEKGIDELNKIYVNYSPSTHINDIPQSEPKPKAQPKPQPNQNFIDEYFEKHFANKDITNKEIMLMFDITRPTIQDWREKGKLIQISDEGERPIKYSKEKLIENLKDGIIKDRLVNIQ